MAASMAARVGAEAACCSFRQVLDSEPFGDLREQRSVLLCNFPSPSAPAPQLPRSSARLFCAKDRRQSRLRSRFDHAASAAKCYCSHTIQKGSGTKAPLHSNFLTLTQHNATNISSSSSSWHAHTNCQTCRQSPPRRRTAAAAAGSTGPAESAAAHKQKKEELISAAAAKGSSDSATVAEEVLDGVEAAAETVSIVGEITENAVEEMAAGELVDRNSAITTVAFWVSAAVVFGIGIGLTEGPTKASEFFAGYLLEQSLSVDNLFVFVLIFSYFKVPMEYQPRVLTYGIAGAVIFRGIMIGLGIATVQAFEAVNLLFAAILIFSSFKLLTEVDDEDDELSNNTVVKFCQKLIPVTDFYDGNKFFTLVGDVKKATPLLLTMAVVELTDIFFAFDSIPAVFGVTRDPFIVFTSNIFAILGLRSLFTLISTSMADLHYLQPAIAVVLGFIGSKLLADFAGYHVATEASLVVVASVLFLGVFLSLRFPKSEADTDGL